MLYKLQLLILLFICFGCTHVKISEKLKLINIVTNESIEGSQCYYVLKELLKPSDNFKYTLKVSLNYKKYPLIIADNSDVIRNGIQKNVSFLLLDKDERVLLNEKFRLLSSYSTMTAIYSSYEELEKVKCDLSRSAAIEIYNRLLLFFSNKENKE